MVIRCLDHDLGGEPPVGRCGRVIGAGRNARAPGLLIAGSNGSFSLPYSRVANAGRLALLVSPIGGTRAYLTESLVLRPGSAVALTVTPLIRQTSVSVY